MRDRLNLIRSEYVGCHQWFIYRNWNESTTQKSRGAHLDSRLRIVGFPQATL
jgi:hypothetical protein